MKRLLLFLLFFVSISTQAKSEWSLEESVDTSNRQTSNSLTAGNSMFLESSWNQDLEITYGTSSSKSESSSQSLETKGLTGDASWTSPSDFSWGASLQYSVDTTNKIQGIQPGINIGQKFFWPSGEDSSSQLKKSFEPYLKIDLGAARNSITPQSNNQKLENRLTLVQTSASANLKLKPLQWLSLRANYTKYGYNRDLANFIQTLETKRVTNQIGSGFSDSIASFLDHKESLNITFYIEDFSMSFKRSFSLDATTPTTAVDTAAEIEWAATQTWDFSLGVGTLTESDLPGSTTHYLASLTATF